MPKYQPRKRMTLPGTKGRSGPAVEMQNQVLSWEGKLVQKSESVGLKLESPRGLVCLFVLKDCPPGFLIQKVCGQFCNSAFVTGSQLLTVMMVVPGPCFQNCRSKTSCQIFVVLITEIWGRYLVEISLMSLSGRSTNYLRAWASPSQESWSHTQEQANQKEIEIGIKWSESLKVREMRASPI